VEKWEPHHHHKTGSHVSSQGMYQTPGQHISHAVHDSKQFKVQAC